MSIVRKRTNGCKLQNLETNEKRNRGLFRTSAIPLVLLLSLSLFIPSMAGFQSGIDGGLGTATAGNGCVCHGIQTEDVVISLDMVSNVSAIVSGETYTLEIAATGGPDQGGSAHGGFLLNVNDGNLVAANDDAGVNSGGDEAAHTLSGNDQRTWLINWTAGTGVDTKFTLRVNMVNGDGASSEADDWNIVDYYLKDDGTFTQSLVEPEARFVAPEWTQDLILVLSGLLMLILSVLALNSKSKGRRKEFD